MANGVAGPDRPDGIAGPDRPRSSAPALPSAALRQGPHLARAPQCRDDRRAFLNLLGYGFALIFNSASQRKKTWLTNFLIAPHGRPDRDQRDGGAISQRPATVILHGIDVDLYSPPADRVAAFAENGSRDDMAIGTFGRVRKQKGSDLFVEAMCRLLPRYPDFSAVVIGLTTVDNRPFVEGLKQQVAARA